MIPRTVRGIALLLLALPVRAEEPTRPVKREIFVKTPAHGVSVLAYSFYTKADGVGKMRLWGIRTKSDAFEAFYRSFSADNGATWSEAEKIDVMFKEREGVRRSYPAPGFVDPVNGRLFALVLEGVFPKDQASEGIRNWYLRYRVSTDGGRTWGVDEQIIQKGEYTPAHPLDGVWVGDNCVSLGHMGNRPIRTRRGHLLVPVQIPPVDKDHKLLNPGGGVRYYDSAVLIGTWVDGNRLVWDLSQRICHDPAKSTRGAFEPAVLEAPDGRIVMVIRGSNAPGQKQPGYRWYTVSKDGGFTWAPVSNWTYEDGTPFFSPSTCSQLLKHSSGKLYWFGIITDQNPNGNAPTFPLIMAEIDPVSLLLVRKSVRTIDDKQAGESEQVMLSNFLVHEDRTTGEIVVNISRPFAASNDRTSDAYLYRIVP